MNSNKIKITYCGTKGSFSEQAAGGFAPDGALLPCASFREAYDRAARKEADLALLPIENSYAGEVATTMDLIYHGDLFVTDLGEMRVVQNLIAIPGAKMQDIKSVISHPQALAQCAEYIAQHHFGEIAAENTAFAAKQVAESGSKEIAAIASRRSAEIYGLEVLAEDIAESKENTTRFVLLAPIPAKKRKGERIVLLFSVSDRSGALLDALRILANYGFNMKSLHSRPRKDLPWQYYFYVEAEGEGDESALLRDLESCCIDAKIAGRYLPGLKIE